MRAFLRVFLLLVASAVALAGCAADAPESAEIPATAVGAEAQWIVDAINAEEVPRDLVTRFGPAMLEAVPVDQLREVFEQMRQARPWTVTRYEGTESQASVRVESSRAPATEVRVSIADDGLIDGLFFAPAGADREPASSWQELGERLDALPYAVSFVVQEEGSAAAVLERDAESAAPLGSVFKLYVLGALADAVERGEIAWDEELVIDDGVRSLPSGELQDRPDGTRVTVLEAAEKMIAISDNTATDLLMRALGRDAVERARVAMSNGSAEPGDPFLTTREAFWLGWGDPGLRARWESGDEGARRALLGEVPSGVPPLESVDPGVTAWTAGIDWFASANAVAAAQFALQERAGTDAGAPLRDILSANPGLDFGGDWDHVAFKGGSAPGVLAGSWYLERTGAPAVAITMLARSEDPAELADVLAAFGPVTDAAALLANR